MTLFKEGATKYNGPSAELGARILRHPDIETGQYDDTNEPEKPSFDDRNGQCQGLWDAMLEALNATGAAQSSVQMIDSTIVRAHQHAAGAKGGLKTRILAARAAATRPRSI